MGASCLLGAGSVNAHTARTFRTTMAGERYALRLQPGRGWFSRSAVAYRPRSLPACQARCPRPHGCRQGRARQPRRSRTRAARAMASLCRSRRPTGCCRIGSRISSRGVILGREEINPAVGEHDRAPALEARRRGRRTTLHFVSIRHSAWPSPHNGPAQGAFQDVRWPAARRSAGGEARPHWEHGVMRPAPRPRSLSGSEYDPMEQSARGSSVPSCATR